MSVENLDKIFQPKSIAVVGASERKGSVGAALMHNLIERGFPGEIFPINPNHQKIGEFAACPSIRDLEAPVDLAVIATPISLVPQIVKDCVDVGVGGAVIISAGGKEIGEQGKKLEAGILKEAGHSGLRIIGPNCVGIMSARSKLNASFANQMSLSGKMAFISQSGAICTAILDLSIKENIGFSYFVSLTLTKRGKIQADMVLVSIGARPASDLAQKAGLRIVENGSIWVDEYMRTDADDVFAVGDCAVKRDFFTRKAAPVWLASTATAEARNAGTNIYGIRVLHQIQGTISAFSTKIGGISFTSAGMTCRACQKEGFRYVTATAVAPDRHPGMLPGASQLKVKLVFADRSGIILGGQVSGGPSAGELINVIALAIQKKVTVRELDMLQIATHPLLTSAPTVHPLINAAHQALAKLRVIIKELPPLKKVA